jgi:hypothetical protein
MPVPNALLIMFDQCSFSAADNAGNKVVCITHPADFYFAYATLERIAREVGGTLGDLKAKSDYVKHPAAATVSEPETSIPSGSFFGSSLRLGSGSITVRRSSSSGAHPPTMDVNGIDGLRACLSEKGWLHKNACKSRGDEIRVEVKFKFNGEKPV